jgi:UTP--glucose-1-phosphate uridylyltransferase
MINAQIQKWFRALSRNLLLTGALTKRCVARSGVCFSEPEPAMIRPIRKAVFPVAGLGTRLLPATKSIPKEMLTIVDRPVIEMVVEEAREAGIEQFIFVTSRNKSALEDHFDKNTEIENHLGAKGKVEEMMALRRALPQAGNLSFTRQQEPLGLGHAVWCARHLVGDEPFAVLLPDMLMQARPGCLKQLMDVYAEHGGNVIAVEEVDHADVHKYGAVGFDGVAGQALSLNKMVEKPMLSDAPSNYIISGRYILQPEIFNLLENQKHGSGGEIQLTDAMIELLQSQQFWGCKFRGQTFDCGDKLGFVLANVAYGLSRDTLRPAMRKKLLELLGLTLPAPVRPFENGTDAALEASQVVLEESARPPVPS